MRRTAVALTVALALVGVLAASLMAAGSPAPVATVSTPTPSGAVPSAPAPLGSAPSAASASPGQGSPAATPTTDPGPSGSPAPDPSPSPVASPAPAPVELPPVQRSLVRMQDAELLKVVARWRSQTGTPGVSVAILWPGGRIWEGAVGEADAARDIPMTPGTAFAYASVSKTFTAALILQLVDEGRLHLDDRVAELLPGQDLHPKMTIRDLLDHTSGLNDFFRVTGIEPALNKDIHRVWSAEDALAFGRSDRVAPGTFWRYSNTGYVYLGQILEKVTGEPWSKLVRERLLDPLGLRHTFIQGDEKPRSPLARGHRLTGTGAKTRATPLGGKDPLVPFTSVVTAAGSAGAVAGTAEDAARWGEALYGGHVLQPATLQAAVDDVKRTAVFKPRIPYGLGVQVVRYGSQLTWGHSGTFTGFKTSIRYLPDRHITIAVLTNQNRSELTALIRELIPLAIARRPTVTCAACR